MAEILIQDGPGIRCEDDDTILRAALRAGIGFPYGCNVGSCGNCRFRLLAGCVEHVGDAPAWSERDRERGRWLGCQARPLEDCRIHVRLDERPIYGPNRMQAKLTGIQDLNHDIREFAFAIEGPDRFLPGQYALLHMPGIASPRPYSMSNLPGSGVWSLLIKRVPEGTMSSALFGCRPGDTVVLDGPYGHAFLVDRPRDLLLVAGGSGLSQMVSILRAATLTGSPPGREVLFYLGGRQPHDLCAEPILSTIPGYGTQVRSVGVISEHDPEWLGPSGFVHDVVRADLGDRLTDLDVYFAGPPPMVRAMLRMLHDAGVDPQNTHHDEIG